MMRNPQFGMVKRLARTLYYALCENITQTVFPKNPAGEISRTPATWEGVDIFVTPHMLFILYLTPFISFLFETKSKTT